MNAAVSDGPKKCEFCGSFFTRGERTPRVKFRVQRFCSKECSNGKRAQENPGGTVTCLNCKVDFEVRGNHKVKTRKFCSNPCASAFNSAKRKNKTRGGKKEDISAEDQPYFFRHNEFVLQWARKPISEHDSSDINGLFRGRNVA
jgi:hypothetical protein